MTPSADTALRTLAMTLMTEVAPHMPNDYLRGSVNLVGFVQMLLAEEFDRAVELRVWENEQMRALFAAGAEVIADQRLANLLRGAADMADGSLRVSALSATNGELRKLLIELQTALETTDLPAARQQEGDVWRFLVSSAQRRSFSIG